MCALCEVSASGHKQRPCRVCSRQSSIVGRWQPREPVYRVAEEGGGGGQRTKHKLLVKKGSEKEEVMPDITKHI